MIKRFCFHFASQSIQGTARDKNRDFLFSKPEIGLFILCGGTERNPEEETTSKTVAIAIGSALEKAARALEASQFSDINTRVVEQVELLLEQAIHKASVQLYEKTQQSTAGEIRGCTLDLLWFLGNRAFTAHVGNGRIYQIRKSGVERLTEDHSFKKHLMDRGLSEEAASKSPYAHVLERYMGKDPITDVDLGVFEIVAGEKFILTSDGIFHRWKESDLIERCSIAENSPQELIDKIYHHGSLPGSSAQPTPPAFKDDATVIIISIADNEHNVSVNLAPNVIPADKKMAALKAVEFFQPLSYKDISTILSIAETKQYPAGATLMKEGDPPTEFWILLSGTIEVLLGKKAVLIACEEMGGKCIGESGILGKTRRRATIRAKAPVAALCIQTEVFGSLMKRDPAFGFRVMSSLSSILSDRTDALNNHLAMNSLSENVPGHRHTDG